MQLSFGEIFIYSAMFGFLAHAVLLGRHVAQREPVTAMPTAVVIIFFSGMWYIGPFSYFGFRKRRPLLAQACLRQMVAFLVLVIALFVASSSGIDF